MRQFLSPDLDGPIIMTSPVADREAAPVDIRLRWAPADGDGSPSGAWWPRTRNAAAELRSLLPEVGAHLGGAVTRVSLNIDSWDADQPRRLRVDDRLVRLGWFHSLDPATVTLVRGSDPRITLHVVPPELDPAAGRESLRDLSTPRGG